MSNLISLKPFKLQQDILACKTSIVSVRCSRRGGKTQTAILKVLQVAFGFPQWIASRGYPNTVISTTAPQTVVVVAPTRSMVQSLHFEPMCALIARTPSLKALVKNINRSNLQINLHGNRPSILYTSLGNDGQADNLRGKRISLAIIDEIQDMRWESVDTVIRTAQIDSPGSQMFCFGTSKGKGNNALWLLHQMSIKNPEQVTEFHYSIYDNPYISAEAIANEKALKSQAVFDREMLGLFTDFPGVIYPGLSEDIFAELPTIKPFSSFLGLDFGSQHCAIVVIQVIQGIAYIVDTFENKSGANMSVQDFTDQILKFSKLYDCVCSYADPSRVDHIMDIRKQGQQQSVLGAARTVTAYNKIVGGICQVANWFEKGQLKIALDHPKRIGNVTPRELFDQLCTYSWESTTDGMILEGTIRKGSLDHLADSIRYSTARLKPSDFRNLLLQSAKPSLNKNPNDPDSSSFDPRLALAKKFLEQPKRAVLAMSKLQGY